MALLRAGALQLQPGSNAIGPAEGIGRHSASFASEAGEPESLIGLKALVKLWTAADDFAYARRDGLGIERADWDLPRCRWHQLRRGKHALSDQLVDRADADTEPGRGRVSADRLGAR